MLLPAQAQQAFKPFQTVLRAGRTAEAGPLAAIGVRRQRELADQQQPAPDILQGFIHFSLFVAENAVTQQAFAHALNSRFIIARLHGDQGKQSGIDGADNFFIDFDAGFGNALDECNHPRMLPESANTGQLTLVIAEHSRLDFDL